jgi:AraC-like DNA-binding protein
VAIRLKADFLRKLGTRHRSRWVKLVSKFVEDLERSPLQDPTALVVLLAELRDQLHSTIGLRSASRMAPACQSAPPTSLTCTGASRADILARFEADVLTALQPPAHAHAALSRTVTLARRIIDEQYDRPLTLGQVAAAVRCSRRQLAASFRRARATTVHGYLTHIRLQRAIELIRRGEKIEAVSLLVGYRSKKNFYHHFKKHVGGTPLAYKTELARRGPPSTPARAAPIASGAETRGGDELRPIVIGAYRPGPTLPAGGRRVAARGRRRQRAALGERLHVLQRAREGCGPLLAILRPRGIVGQHRVVEEDRVHDLRRRRGDRPRLERAVIQVVRTAFTNRLRVGV